MCTEQVFLFESEEFKQELLIAFKELELFEFECDLGDISKIDVCKDTETSDNKVILNSNYIISWLSMKGIDNGLEDVSAGDLVDFAEGIKGSKFLSNSRVRTKYCTYIHVKNGDDFDPYMYEVRTEQLNQIFIDEFSISDKEYSAGLVRGITPFGANALARENWEEGRPPINYDDLFVWIHHDKDASEIDIDHVFTAFTYELYVRFSIALHEFEHPAMWDEEDLYPDIDDRSKAPTKDDMKSISLDLSLGLPDLYTLFMDSQASAADYMKIIGFSKVLEWVASTATRYESHTDLRKILRDKEVYKPKAEYLDHLLERSYEYGRVRRNDSESLRQLVKLCIEPSAASKLLPPYLKSFGSHLSSADPKLVEKAIKEISRSISATRNQIVHAKPNYNVEGGECPENEYSQFVLLVELLAKQAIDWYKDLSPHERVL